MLPFFYALILANSYQKSWLERDKKAKNKSLAYTFYKVETHKIVICLSLSRPFQPRLEL